ncbi:MAG: PilZ domain-containing protein [Spirochaetota bacterium]|nr:PilZ domain-containing protein [Spirochaetota bacterium]
MRKETRRTLIYYLDIICASEGSIIGKLADITLNGLLILSDDPIKIGLSGTFLIKMPPGLINENSDMEIDGEIKWVKQDTKTSLYYSGMEFTNNNQNIEKDIHALISRIGFSDGTKTIHTGHFDPKFY